MKVLIVEDEAPAFRRLQKILQEIEPEIEIVEVIDSVADTIKWLQTHQHPDLLFLDIQLSDGLSFEIFKEVEVLKPIIFTTAFDEYTLQAFKVNSIDYLLKPIKKDDLAQSLQKLQSLQQVAQPNISQLLGQLQLNNRKFKNRFLVKHKEELLSVPTTEVAYFFTRYGVVRLVKHDGSSYPIDLNLDELQHQLDPEHFYRFNRQYLGNIAAISSVHKWHKSKLLLKLQPAATEEVTVSAERAADFKEWFGN